MIIKTYFIFILLQLLSLLVKGITSLITFLEVIISLFTHNDKLNTLLTLRISLPKKLTTFHLTLQDILTTTYSKNEIFEFPISNFVNNLFLDGLFYGISLISLLTTWIIYKIFNIQYWKTLTHLQLFMLVVFIANDLFLAKHTVLAIYSVTTIYILSIIIALSLFLKKEENHGARIVSTSFLNGIVFISFLSLFFYLSQRSFLTPNYKQIIDISVAISFIALQLSITFLRRKKSQTAITFYTFCTIILFSFTLTRGNVFTSIDQILVTNSILKVFTILLYFTLISSCYKLMFKKRDVSLQNEINNQQYILMLKHYNTLLTEEKKQKEIIFKDGNNPIRTSSKSLKEQLKANFKLTDREIEVLHLIWEGKTNKEIGDILDISLSTTKYHVSNLFTKLNVRSRTQIFALKYE